MIAQRIRDFCDDALYKSTFTITIINNMYMMAVREATSAPFEISRPAACVWRIAVETFIVREEEGPTDPPSEQSRNRSFTQRSTGGVRDLFDTSCCCRLTCFQLTQDDVPFHFSGAATVRRPTVRSKSLQQ